MWHSVEHYTIYRNIFSLILNHFKHFISDYSVVRNAVV